MKKDHAPNKLYNFVLAFVHRTQGYKEHRQTWNPAVKEVVTRLPCYKKEGRTQQKTSRIVYPGPANENPAFRHLQRQTWNPVLREELIEWKPKGTFTDRLKAYL